MRNIQIPINLINELNVPQIIDITDELPKNPVKDWDALNKPRKLEALTDIVWHHTGSFLDVNADATRHANNHIRSKANEPTGDGGLPYTFYIKNGQGYQTNDLCTFVYGISSNNKYTIHIAVEGRYSPHIDEKTGVLIQEADELSDENLRAMIALELTLRPLLPNYRATNGHNYYKASQCPGISMTKFKEEVSLADLRIKKGNQWAERIRKCGGINNQINFMDGLIRAGEENGDAAWALHWKERVYNIMKEQGLL